MVSGSLGRGDCRYTLDYGAGNRGTLGTGALLVSLGDGTGGITLRDGTYGGKVEGSRIGVFLIVIGNMGGNGSIVRCGCWARWWSK